MRAGGFRNNVPMTKDRCILFTKKVGTAKHLVIMRKKFESRHFSGPNIDYIDEFPIPEPKRQNDDKAHRGSVEQAEETGPPSKKSKERILCTLPITSAECERSFSTLRRLKAYLRSTMSSERESGLALMNINYHRDINIKEVINTFAQRQPRRLLFA